MCGDIEAGYPREAKFHRSAGRSTRTNAVRSLDADPDTAADFKHPVRLANRT